MLKIVDVILGLIEKVKPLVEEIEQHDRSLGDQLRRSMSSVSLNTGEGGEFYGKKKMYQFTVALGSARESFIALRTAAAWGHIGPLPPDVVADFNQVIGTLVNLVGRNKK